MKYVSTRGRQEELNFEEVLLSGLATDGGLYVPKVWPQISEEEMVSLAKLPYQDIAFKIMKPFIGNTFSDDEFHMMIEKAYLQFDHEEICPLVQLSKNHYLLELFHGPTLAFKDIAMQLIGQMFNNILRKKNLRATVVAATSGDTGSAAMAAFKYSDLVDVFILFPNGRVSNVQRRQMTTVGKPNIHALAVEGDFDDCQSLVKKMFNDTHFRKTVNLTGVNSINWARVMSQIVYYFSSAIALGAPKRRLNFTVPTGNFGDIFAAYVAKKMGLPIGKLIIASNQNDILHRTLNNGIYSRERLKQTISPSMDIQVASNFERLLFDLYDRRVDIVQNSMQQLLKYGKFELSSHALKKMRQDFLSGAASEKITSGTIKKTLVDYGQLVCPHTAVGLAVANEFLERQDISPMITLATAHPAKFPDAVEQYTDVSPNLPERYNDLFLKDEILTVVKNNFDEITNIISKRTSV